MMRLREWCRERTVFRYDRKRFLSLSGCRGNPAREACLARLIMQYHIVEKGLTMPDRRLGFGQDVVLGLMRKVDAFAVDFGTDDPQWRHAVGVLRAYADLHRDFPLRADLDLVTFLSRYPDVPASVQPHLSSVAFYARRTASFPEFSAARHTLRHYAKMELSVERLRAAVELCRNTPTACNRQYCRVYCLTDKEMIAQLLEIQGGSRGFGHLADKLLVVVADLEGVSFVRERDDVFTNGGLFLMNLCYSLFYHQIAHCVLNWSREPWEDLQARKILPIKKSETIVALLTCGETPETVDVCASPRRPVEEIFKVL